MAKNEVFEDGDNLSLTMSHPAVPVSGDPCRYGEFIAVAQANELANGQTPCTFKGVHLLTVKGIDGGGNSAVANGDKIYYTDADTPPLSKKATGRLAGFAVETPTNAGTVTSGSTTVIGVRLSN
jgi:predicted RecA/RadA family phage recombinase